MKEEDLDEIRDCIEEVLESALEEKLESLADEMRDAIEEVSYDSVSEAIEEGIEQFLYDHEFKLSDGTIIQSRPMTKVMNPDKTKVLICYGGLRVDGCSLVVQTAISRWESLYSFETPEAAIDALKTIIEAIEQRVSLIEL